MKYLLLPSLALLGSCAVPRGAAAASGKVLLVGDSWAEKGGNPLKEVLYKHHNTLEVVNKGIGGSTAQQWAKNKDSVKDLIRENGGEEVKHVWVSVGGNDASGFLPGCQLGGKKPDECVDEIIARISNDTKTFLDPVVEAYPDVKIFQFGYDILNFGENAECKAFGLALFPSCIDNTECINTHFVRIQHDYVEVITQNYTQHHALNVLGTLQHAGHDAKAQPGHPDLTQWSPAKLMEDNCIHASQPGFEIIFEQVYADYFANETTTKHVFAETRGYLRAVQN